MEFSSNRDIPLQAINRLIEKISSKSDSSKSILFLDEIFVKNDEGELSSIYDWSDLNLRPNVDIFLAANPQGRNFKQKFEMFVGNITSLKNITPEMAEKTVKMCFGYLPKQKFCFGRYRN